jgi:hypothetical protein
MVCLRSSAKRSLHSAGRRCIATRAALHSMAARTSVPLVSLPQLQSPGLIRRSGSFRISAKHQLPFDGPPIYRHTGGNTLDGGRFPLRRPGHGQTSPRPDPQVGVSADQREALATHARCGTSHRGLAKKRKPRLGKRGPSVGGACEVCGEKLTSNMRSTPDPERFKKSRRLCPCAPGRTAA